MTVQHFLAAIKQISAKRVLYDDQELKRINMLDHFSKIQILENKLENLYLRGPLVIGIVKSEIQLEDDEDYDEEDEDEESMGY